MNREKGKGRNGEGVNNRQERRGIWGKEEGRERKGRDREESKTA